jgi:hypothetical protein
LRFEPIVENKGFRVQEGGDGVNENANTTRGRQCGFQTEEICQTKTKEGIDNGDHII